VALGEIRQSPAAVQLRRQRLQAQHRPSKMFENVQAMEAVLGKVYSVRSLHHQ